MKSHWHETIQQYVDGQSSAEETVALFNGLNEDADLRALYLDYMNLDMALGAMADAVAVEENGSNRMTSLHEASVGALWRWAAAATAMGGSDPFRDAAESVQTRAHWPGRGRRHYFLAERDCAPRVRHHFRASSVDVADRLAARTSDNPAMIRAQARQQTLKQINTNQPL